MTEKTFERRASSVLAIALGAAGFFWLFRVDGRAACGVLLMLWGSNVDQKISRHRELRCRVCEKGFAYRCERCDGLYCERHLIVHEANRFGCFDKSMTL